MDYTYEEVLEACNEVMELVNRKKCRPHMDMRNYLVALRYYKYYETEDYISKDFGIKRCSINHSKKQPAMLIGVKDPTFLSSVADLMARFPYKFPENRDPSVKRSCAIIVYLEYDLLSKFDGYMEEKSIRRRDVAAKQLIKKALKIWGG
jgi:hypothetical protein